jgi:CO/xanthine dehydrogenase Mo-binding subunit
MDRPDPDGSLHAATVRLPIAAARIEALDVSPALALPGVVRVLTAHDVAGTNRFGLVEPDQPVLAEEWVRGASDVVALVLATSGEAARAGADAVAVRYSPLPLLTDAERALRNDAPAVHPRREATEHPNLLAERRIRRGDPEGAMASAHRVIEGVYRTERVEHFFLAPEAGLAVPEPDGTVALHVATQWPEVDLAQAARALDIPRERLRLVQETVGGAFGGREDVSLQILLLLAADATGLPVRMAWDRAESIRGHGKRHPFRIRHRLGVDARGHFVAAELDVLIDAGCYASTSRLLLDNALAQACGPYAIEHVSAMGRAVFTHNPYTCAFRGFGANQVAFAMEQQVNKVAEAIGLDPAEVRRRNFLAAPGTIALGSRVESTGGLRRTLEVASEAAAARALPPSDDAIARGRGLASAMKNVGFGFGHDDHATAEVTWGDDRVRVRIGAAEVGQGSTTVLAQIAATVLDVDVARVEVEWRDTRIAPEAGSSSASRQTMASGNAVRGACQVLKERAEAAGGRHALSGSDLHARHTWRFPATEPFDRRPALHLPGFGWATCIADVEVDRATGLVTVVRVVHVVDAGRVVNPALARGQVEGGVVMGQGYALQERLELRDGMPVTRGFEDGGVPTILDAVADIEALFVEDPDPLGPFGARGLGEICMIPVVPAITAAIHAACGVWMDHIPATPERVRDALRTDPSVEP